MDTRHGLRVTLIRAAGLVPALLAGLFATGVGCMAPRPPRAGGEEGVSAAYAGRFDPAEALRRWDDLREPAVRFSYHRPWNIKAPETVSAEFFRRLSAGAPGRGEVRLRHADVRDRVRLEPVPPILIPEPFDTVEIGLEARSGGADDRAPAWAAEARLWVRDRSGKDRPIELGSIPYARVLRQRALGPAFLREGAFPFHLVAIEMTGFREPSLDVLLDDIVFYAQCRIPLPSRYTADGRAWPRRTARMRERILSTAPVGPRGAEGQSVWRDGGAFVLASHRPAGDAVYRIAPTEDGRIAVDFAWNGQPRGRWPGVRIESDDGETGGAALRLYRVDDRTVGWMPGGTLRAEAWLERGALRIRLAGGRAVRHVTLAAPDRPFRRLSLPFLHDGPEGGPAVYGHGDLAVAVLPDPTVSNASRLRFPVPGDPEGEAAARADYHPASDGRRPWFEEEVVLVVSSRLDEVLPPAPAWGDDAPGPQGARAPWLDREWADEETRGRLAAFGMEQWRSPGVWPGGWADLLLGDEIRPEDAGWSRDVLLRDTDGHWVEGTEPGAYRMKIDAVRARARAHIAEAPLPPDLLPMPASARPPWAFADYDARAYGAGSFRPGVEALAGLLQEVSAGSGAQWMGDDASIWWYAAMLDAWRVSEERGRRLWAGPLIPMVSQLTLRPCGFGVGIGRMPPGEADDPHAWPRKVQDRYLALHLAYGLDFLSPPPGLGPAVLSRLYHPAHAVQSARRGQPVVEMAYEVDGRLDSPIRALSAGDPRRLDRLYLRYANGLELWVNGSAQEDWPVRVGGEQWVLAPSGWVAAGAGILAFVARGEGDAVRTGARAAGMEFWDADGRDGAFVGVGGAGQVLALAPGDASGELFVFDIDGTGRLRFAPAHFGLQSPVLVDAVDPESGLAVEAESEDMPDGFVRLRGPARPVRYRVRMR